MCRQTITQIFFGLVLTFIFMGCGTAKKSLVSTDDAKKEIISTYRSLKEAQKLQVDLLAYEEYLEARKLYMEAKDDLAKGDDLDEVVQKAREAKTQFHMAKKVAISRKGSAKRILKVRKAALKSGVKKSRKLFKSLKVVDGDLRDETDLFSKKLEPEVFSEFQKKYLMIEAKSVQNIKLGKVREALSTAKKNDARDFAAKTYREAKLDLKEAENLIMRSPRSRGVYGKAVQKANSSAVLLTDVMKVIAEGGEGTSERTALRIVQQERKLGSLNSDLGKLKGDLTSTKSTLDQTHLKLASKKAELEKASTYVALQKAMDDVRKNFTAEEAAVYQQGTKLIIRLKKINFTPGRSAIPGESLRLLSKVSAIVKELDPAAVIIQGHTDASGASSKNQILSKKRAQSVASYLSSNGAGEHIVSVGFGESKPIASNKTREGRALNRRVDVVLRAKDRSLVPQKRLTDTNKHKRGSRGM